MAITLRQLILASIEHCASDVLDEPLAVKIGTEYFSATGVVVNDIDEDNPLDEETPILICLASDMKSINRMVEENSEDIILLSPNAFEGDE